MFSYSKDWSASEQFRSFRLPSSSVEIVEQLDDLCVVLAELLAFNVPITTGERHEFEAPVSRPGFLWKTTEDRVVSHVQRSVLSD